MADPLSREALSANARAFVADYETFADPPVDIPERKRADLSRTNEIVKEDIFEGGKSFVENHRGRPIVKLYTHDGHGCTCTTRTAIATPAEEKTQRRGFRPEEHVTERCYLIAVNKDNP